LSRRAETAIAVGLAAAPAAWLAWRAATGGLGADPVETIALETGRWTLRLLLVTLAITPARRLLGWTRLAPHRRTFGLAAFGYATLHFLTFVGLDQGFALSAIVGEIAERRWITAGFAAFVLMIPLAATSTRGMARRLGGVRWRRLHRLVYASAALGVFHYGFAVKADTRLPLLYAAVLAALLAARLVPPEGKRRDRDE